MHKRILAFLFGTFFAVGLTSCGGGGSGPTPAPPAVIPQTPQNFAVASGCVSPTLCYPTFSWTQPDYKISQNFAITIAIEQGATTIDTITIPETGISNAGADRNKALSPSTTYSAVYYASNSAGKSPLGTPVSFITPAFTPLPSSGLAGNGLFIYDDSYDLQSSASSCASKSAGDTATSQAISAFSGLNAINGIRYLYPVLGYENSVPSAASYSSFNDYFSHTVKQLCSDKPDNLGFGYFTSANAGTSNKIGLEGTLVTQAYNQWPVSTGQPAVRVMPISEFADNNPFDANNPNDISYFAQAVGQIIDQDPNAAGVIFDIEHTPTADNYKQGWYAFFLDLTNYFKNNAPVSGQNPRMVAIVADKAFFTAAHDASGTHNILNLFSVPTATNHDSSGGCNNNCFVIIPQYDLGSTPNGNPNVIEQDLFTLSDYTSAIQTSDSTDPQSTVGIAVTNEVPFQFAIPASASFNNWAQAYVYGNLNAAGFSFSNSLTQSSGCPTGLPNCTVVTQTGVAQSDYTCTALTTFHELLDGTPGSLGCIPQYSVSVSAFPNMSSYYMGTTLWRLADTAAESSCNPGSSSVCVSVVPQTLTNNDLGLAYLNNWMANFKPGI